MNSVGLIWTIVGALLVALLIVVVKLTSPARLRRRLKRARDPIVSKARQPSVKFSVNTPKEKE